MGCFIYGIWEAMLFFWVKRQAKFEECLSNILQATQKNQDSPKIFLHYRYKVHDTLTHSYPSKIQATQTSGHIIELYYAIPNSRYRNHIIGSPLYRQHSSYVLTSRLFFLTCYFSMCGDFFSKQGSKTMGNSLPGL